MAALSRLGELADHAGTTIELVVFGGTVMVLAYGARWATRDVDGIILAPKDTQLVRHLAGVVGAEPGWPADWLNDAAKGYVVGLSDGPELLSAKGIRVTAQLLAMKLSAWRDDVDISDARRLLPEIAGDDQEAIWRQVEPFLVPGDELKAQ